MQEVLSYGEFLPLLKIIEQFKLERFFTDTFDSRIAHQIIVLSLFKTLTHLSLRDLDCWYEGTMLTHQFGDISLSSQNISNVLSHIGKHRVEDKLATHLIESLESKRTLFYDITSISSYSELIRMLEWGYNRDGLDMAQVNLSVIMDKDAGIPITYELYPGSISDVIPNRYQDD